MKDYKKILEGVVNIISATEKCDIGFVNICSYIGENCPELAESKDEEKIRKALIHMVTSNKELHFGINNYNGVIWEDILAWLEKQGEQKPADKVEPKFHEGDFIKHNKGNVVYKIISVNGDSYHVENIETGNRSELLNAEPNFHLWTIQDAKDGDVVVDKSDGAIGIFQSIGHHPNGGSCNDPSYCFLHCRYDDGFFYADFEHGNMIDSDDLIPATKEKRDLLFKKMKEAGYEWNAEKKEMKKVERKPDELPKGEDYGADGLYNAIRILEKTLGKVEGYQTDDGILEHECAISAVKELFKQQLAWSALDERNLEEIIDVIKANKNNAPDCDLPTYDRFLSWLQSLRPQNKYAYNPYKAVVESIAEMCKHYDKASHSGLRDFYDNVKVKCKDAKEYDSLFPQSTWMPSDEQMEALDDFIYTKYPNIEKYGSSVKSLYQDLKKLKVKQ